MKYKDIEIRKKPWWTFLYMRRASAFTTLDKIYVNKKIFKQIKNNDLSVKNKAILEHEITHIKRFRKFGLWEVEIRYWLDKNFRYEEEIAAIENQMKVIKKHGKKYDFEKTAKSLSGFGYLWCVNYNKALKDLKNIWNNL